MIHQTGVFYWKSC